MHWTNKTAAIQVGGAAVKYGPEIRVTDIV
jgi:hypothetical protein